MSYLLETEDGRIIGIFALQSEVKSATVGLADDTRVEKIHASQVIGCDRKYGYDWLFCVNFGCHNIWVEAFDAASAIVTAIKVSSANPIREVREYSISRESGTDLVFFEETHSVPDFVYPLLASINDFNIDLVSLALSYALVAQDEDEMKKWEILGIGEEEYCSPLSLTCRELWRRVKVWHFPSFLEETDASREVFSLYKGCERVKDTEELLCLSYLFERWAGCDSVYPYSLFTFLIDGRIDSTVEKLSWARKILFS